MDKKITLGIILTLVAVAIAVSIYGVICANKPLEQAIATEPEYLEVSDEILILSGWNDSETLDIVASPSESGEVVGTLAFNEEIEYTIYNNDWYEVVNRDVKGYVPSASILDEDTGYTSYEQYVLDKVVGYTEYDVPCTSGFKSYMDYRTITATSTRQYRLQNRYAETGDYGIRMVNGRYCIALGSYFSDDVGQYVDLILENGTVIPCILGDQKADAHTDSNNIVTVHSGCASEFIVNSDSLSSEVRNYGNISKCRNDWDSRVVKVKVYNENIFDE